MSRKIQGGPPQAAEDSQDQVFAEFASNARDTGQLLEAWESLRDTRPGGAVPPRSADFLVVSEARRQIGTPAAGGGGAKRWLAICAAAACLALAAWVGLRMAGPGAAVAIPRDTQVEVLSSGPAANGTDAAGDWYDAGMAVETMLMRMDEEADALAAGLEDDGGQGPGQGGRAEQARPRP